MSCFIVSPAHIDVLASAYARLNLAGAPLLNLNRVGRALLRENVASFEACYAVRQRPRGHAMRREMAAGLRAMRAYRFTRRRAKPAAIAKLARSYDRQACEHDGYEASAAKAIVDALMARYPETLPGYDAMPWAIDDARDLAAAAGRPGR